ncbi:MAG: hypothetical protein AAFR17_05315 [Pseudomonadota bacterium]
MLLRRGDGDRIVAKPDRFVTQFRAGFGKIGEQFSSIDKALTHLDRHAVTRSDVHSEMILGLAVAAAAMVRRAVAVDALCAFP